MRDQSSKVSMVNKVKRVVKMFWKRLGSDFRKRARSTTEKRTGSCSGPNQNQNAFRCTHPSLGFTQPLADPLPPTPVCPRVPAAARPPCAGYRGR